MSDIVDRLKECANGLGSFKTDRGDFGLCDDAADEITCLRKLVKAAYVEGAVDWASNEAHLSIHVDFAERFLETDAYRQLQGADTPQAEKGEG